jgi:histidine ammonia-lyase
MIAQYTAAALVSENKVLAHPACVDSIPTSANKEDHVSMGTIAIRQTREILDNVAHIIAVELLCAAQSYDLITSKQKLDAGRGTYAAYKMIRKRVPFLDQDRVLSRDIETVVDMIQKNEILNDVERAVGSLRLSL